MQSPGATITIRRFPAPAPAGKTSRAVKTTSGADKNNSSTSPRKSSPFPLPPRTTSAPPARTAASESPPNSTAGNRISKRAPSPRRSACREIAAHARHAASAESPARIGGGSAIIAQIPVSAAAKARQNAAAKNRERPGENDRRDAGESNDESESKMESESIMTAKDNTNGAIFPPVPDLAALTFSGADAAAFMQGQFSADVSALPQNGGWQRSAYCNPKGRMLANFILCRRDSEGDEYAALLSADIADETAKRLRMFVLRAKVQIARAPAAFAFAFGGETEPGFFSDADDILTVGEGGGRKLLCCLRGEIGRAIPPEGAMSGDPLAWRRAQIADAIPWVRSETREMFIPQTVNYEAPPLNGVNFQKGCYVGQEVIARLHYRGKVKRRARPCVGVGAPPPPGATVRDPEGQAAGNIIDAVPASENGGNEGGENSETFSALVCAQLSAPKLFLEDSREIRLLPPPHPIPE